MVGAGGREHALIRALLRSPVQPELLAAPGNAGIAGDRVPCQDVAADDVEALVRLARDEACDLVVVGPEAPLVAGLVDALDDAGVRAFGPTAEAARIEGSKAFAKDIMAAVGVPTASHVLLRTRQEAIEHLTCASYPAVLKADVLAAGKGVLICETETEARAAVEELFVERRFGDTEVLLEEHLDGEELSLLALCDGVRAVPLAPARDFKRIGEGDEGPNTGGMGSYSPVPGIEQGHVEVLARAIHQPVVDELRRRGTPYHGVLYAGLMMTSAGPRVLEYNCRFGDPEAQAVLPRLRSDVMELLSGAATEEGLEHTRPAWSSSWAVTVVLASRGYPDSSSSGDVISGLEAVDSLHTEVLHAGTAERGGKIVTAGGRVLNVTGIGDTADEARQRAYAAADRIEFSGKQLRRDIGARADVKVVAGA